MKKTVFVKMDCRLEPQIDREKLNVFFEKLKFNLKIDIKLPPKNTNIEKKNKI